MGGLDARLARAHDEISLAFVAALVITSCKHVEAARGMGVTANTIANYVTGKTPVNVARVLAFPKIEKAFRDALCRFNHAKPSAPYVLKPRGSK